MLSYRRYKTKFGIPGACLGGPQARACTPGSIPLPPWQMTVLSRWIHILTFNKIRPEKPLKPPPAWAPQSSPVWDQYRPQMRRRVPPPTLHGLHYHHRGTSYLEMTSGLPAASPLKVTIPPFPCEVQDEESLALSCNPTSLGLWVRYMYCVGLTD